jgi:hypothetical protein
MNGEVKVYGILLCTVLKKIEIFEVVLNENERRQR